MENIERKKRIPLRFDVRISHQFPAEGLDLSADGMYIYTKHTARPGSIIELSISMDGETYELSAKVAHEQPGIGFGLSFDDMPEDVAVKFREYLEQG